MRHSRVAKLLPGRYVTERCESGVEFFLDMFFYF